MGDKRKIDLDSLCYHLKGELGNFISPLSASVLNFRRKERGEREGVKEIKEGRMKGRRGERDGEKEGGRK